MTARKRHQIMVAALLSVLVTAWGQITYAAEPQQLKDYLQERWFEIEIIIFERLDVLDVNSSEALTLAAPRAWPKNMREFGSLLPPAADARESLAPLSEMLEPSEFCLGYPILAEEDPVHPALLPPEDIDSEGTRSAEQIIDEEQLADGEVLESGDELLVDAQDTPQPPANDPQLTITPHMQFLDDIADFEEELYASSFSWLDDDLTLVTEVKAINRQNHLRPLIHRRWRQPVPERGKPQPVYLASAIDVSSPLTVSGLAKLEGYIGVTVGRYLHFAPRLWYHADNLGLSPVPLPATGPLPAPDFRLYMELDESRRLRSGDLHYLDHPKLGVIVRIDPIIFPDSLVSAWEALADPAQEGL